MADLPEELLDRVEGLTRRARETPDENEAAAYREEREELLADRGYTARVREDDGDSVLVCYPDEWVEDGVVQVEDVEDTDRAFERPLAGSPDADWETVATENDAVVSAVVEDHGEPHASTARALADYASNHHATTIDRLTDDQLATFREEYFPRNAWPSDEQAARLAESFALVRKKATSASDAPPG